MAHMLTHYTPSVDSVGTPVFRANQLISACSANHHINYTYPTVTPSAPVTTSPLLLTHAPHVHRSARFAVVHQRVKNA